jgi:hypothetical protein
MKKNYPVIFFSFFVAVSSSVSASSKYSDLIDSLYSAENDKIDALVENQRAGSITEEDLEKRTKIKQQVSELVKMGIIGDWLACEPIVAGEGGLKEIEMCLLDTAKIDQLLRSSALDHEAKARVINQQGFSSQIGETYARDQQAANLKHIRADNQAMQSARSIYQQWYNILKKRKDDLLKESGKDTGVDIFD